MPTPHFLRIREFMQKAGQDTPACIEIPDESTRILRAKLILEEALETLTALGVTATVAEEANGVLGRDTPLSFHVSGEPDLEEIVDGCADISVVTVGTLIAFGVDDEPVLEEVDNANLRKFAEGSYRREDGKWMKPPGWTKPDIMGTLGKQEVLAD